jgi:transcriptional regulator GlxA family with amidase domain
MIGSRGAPASIGLYLVPQFSMIAFSSLLEVLRMANQLSAQTLYQWTLASSDGNPVTSSNGLSLGVEHSASARQRYDSTIHWENLAAAREEFPHLVLSPELYEIDRKRYTCAGGIAPMDMMLSEVRTMHGNQLAMRISEQFMCERIRDQHDRQRVPLTQRIGASQPKLAEAVSLMEANIEEPITLDELSHHVGLSRRQLERLFQRYLHCVPTRYYLELRLERARQLLLQSSMPIVDIALACGFISAPHFSKCYRDTFSLPPRDERRRAAGVLSEDKVRRIKPRKPDVE